MVCQNHGNVEGLLGALNVQQQNHICWRLLLYTLWELETYLTSYYNMKKTPFEFKVG